MAAGFSSRMEKFKPLIDVDGKTLLEHAVWLFEEAKTNYIVTVLGHRAEDLVPVLKATSSHFVVNEKYPAGMLSSVKKGVEALQHECDAFFLLPADIPFVRPATVLKLLDEYKKAPSTLIFYPQFQSRRGHPPLISSSISDNILSHNGDDGLRSLLRQFSNHAVDVVVNDPFVRRDIDTPEDLLSIQSEMLNN